MNNLIQRPRRLRQNKTLRSMLSQTDIQAQHLIYPLFVKEGLSRKSIIDSMPGHFQWPLKDIAREAHDCWNKGIKSILLFGIPSKKDAHATQSYHPNGIVQKAIKAIKDK